MKSEIGTRGRMLIAFAMATLSAALLTACVTPPPAQPVTPVTPGPQTIAQPAPTIVQPLPQAPSLADVLLVYQQSLLQMKREDLQREAANLAEQGTSSRAMLQRAMVLATLRGPGDLARAQQLAEQAARSIDNDARSLRPLAQLLASSYGDLRRQTEQAERLSQQAREQQRRIDQLDHMIEGLKAIERNLATRPGASVPSAPSAPAVPAK